MCADKSQVIVEVIPQQETHYFRLCDFPQWIIDRLDVRGTDARGQVVPVEWVTKRMALACIPLEWTIFCDVYHPIHLTDGSAVIKNLNNILGEPGAAEIVAEAQKAGPLTCSWYADPPAILRNGHWCLPDKIRKTLEDGFGQYYKWTGSEVVEVTVNRRSHSGKLKFDPVTGMPLNPAGRTGLTGRAFLGRWGPNHAADHVVVRFTADGKMQIALAYRARDGKWAIPGGMVDFDENAIMSSLRELSEETGLNLLDQLKAYFSSAGSDGEALFLESEEFVSWISAKQVQGRDNRNTDHAWMETMCLVTVMGPEMAEKVKAFDVQDKDEIGTAAWVTVTEGLLSGQEVHTVFTSSKPYAGELWDTHVAMVSEAVKQIVARGHAKLVHGCYMKV